MIFGRPTNLWLGVVVAGLAVLQIVLVNVLHYDAVLVSTLLAAVGAFLGTVISLIANGPPSVPVGSNINVTTPAGQPNVLATVNSSTDIQPVNLP